MILSDIMVRGGTGQLWHVMACHIAVANVE